MGHKLTPAIAGAYYGAQYQTADGIVTLQSVQRTGFHGSSESRPSRFYSYDEAKLLLIQVSDITDEDAVEVACIAIGVGAKNPMIKRDGDIRVYMEYGISRTICVIKASSKQDEHGREYFYVYNKDIDGTHSISVFGTSRITDYLRFKGYDIGCEEIPSLIDAGVAIDINTLNNQ